MTAEPGSCRLQLHACMEWVRSAGLRETGTSGLSWTGRKGVWFLECAEMGRDGGQLHYHGVRKAQSRTISTICGRVERPCGPTYRARPSRLVSLLLDTTIFLGRRRHDRSGRRSEPLEGLSSGWERSNNPKLRSNSDSVMFELTSYCHVFKIRRRSVSAEFAELGGFRGGSRMLTRLIAFRGDRTGPGPPSTSRRLGAGRWCASSVWTPRGQVFQGAGRNGAGDGAHRAVASGIKWVRRQWKQGFRSPDSLQASELWRPSGLCYGCRSRRPAPYVPGVAVFLCEVSERNHGGARE